jgi:hypothetical protein
MKEFGMRKKRKPKAAVAKARPAPRRRALPINLWLICLLPAAVLVVGLLLKYPHAEIVRPEGDHHRPANTVTFTKDIAPITLDHCAGCHRPGESGPFSLITYQEVKKHARQIAEVTARRYMPPWLPEPGDVEIEGARRLSSEEIGLIQQWVAEGAREGAASDLPPTPKWPQGWQLGEPDLVIKMERPYHLPAEGIDVYRNLVLPVPLATNRYVSAIELHPGNKTVHHAFMRFDRTQQSRRLEGQDGEPGFDSMETPISAEGPEGFFLSWQPGKRPSRLPDGLTWELKAGSDLVLQLHMRPSGKVETIQPTIGFFFTDQPPSKIAFKLGLSSFDIDIPAGEREYWVRDSYVLPVDVDVLGVLPHAHYLGKELRAFAVLPDGSKQWLLRIKNWDFNWQGDYRFVKPISLPKRSTLTMEYSYDNSTNNLRNPNHPPKRVRYGLQTTDEMAGLMIQVLLRSQPDLEKLAQDYQFKVVKNMISFYTFELHRNPQDAKAHAELGKALLALGRTKEARQHLEQALAIMPGQADAHYHLGLMLEDQHDLAAAQGQYEAALSANPELYQAHNNLGLLLMQQGRLAEAKEHFLEVIRIHPEDTIARFNLDLVKRATLGQ